MRFATIQRSVNATVEPVTLDEARVHLHVTGIDHDDYITALIPVARQWCEEYTHRAFLSQTWISNYHHWPYNRVFELLRPPTLSVTSVKYFDADNSEQAVDASNYAFEIGFPATVRLHSDFSLPTVTRDRLQPISVEFVSGWGTVAADVPSPIVQAILLLIGHYFTIRQPVTERSTNSVPMSVESLLMPFVFRRG